MSPIMIQEGQSDVCYGDAKIKLIADDSLLIPAGKK